MATTDLGACEWFVWDLRRSNLIDRGQLDQIISEFLKKQPGAEPPDLAQYLVNEGILSPFQSERLLQGKTQGLVLGPYTLIDALGTGSMGTVYKAVNRNDNKWYAIKVLPRRSMWNVRIARRQVRAFEQCRHPAVVPFVDVGTSGGTHYLAWPLVEGTPLEELVRQQGPLPEAQAALYALQTAEGLNVCHQRNLIHGLIKPSNLMVGADNQVYILDFGIGTLLAESEGESLVDTMSTANTLTSGLDCGSPESILDPTVRTPAGDQYSLGCTLYFCLTGQYPFPEGTAVEKMMAHQMKQPEPIRNLNPNVSDAMIAIVEKLMQKQPEDRFPRTADVIEALRPIAEQRAGVVTASPPPLAAATKDNGQAEDFTPPPAEPIVPAAAPVASPAEPPPLSAATARPVQSQPPRPTPPPTPPKPSVPPAAARPTPAASPPPAAPKAPPPRPVAPTARPQPAPPPRPQPPNIARPTPPVSPAPPPRPTAEVTPPPPRRPPAPPRAVPTRESLQAPRPRPVPQGLEEVSDAVDIEEDQELVPVQSGQSLEERLGTVGLVLLMVLLACLGWFLMSLIAP
ncbi:MAG: hypothetical protein KatS3mg105_1344 [Gemmatales bacterium]|nr:MAG: hypothetical protein KatS3mg105_1344 [Gemmatales bacterium]